ncbi:MAG TPA: type I DNA topoisomerase [Epulopiscium sp.]|nr:type I DNA topoisomerase [Candidatus Epulonipiscium sp.]
MADKLVIVESAAKVNTIKKFLGRGYKVEASLGHVRDLPKSQLGVNIEEDFEPKYITIRGKGELLAKLRKQAKTASKIYLATDPDREGEAISWHLYHSLKLEGKNVSRISFNEITETAVKDAIKNAREIDMDLVDAQQARRMLDRLVGYQISPILWKKVRKGLSAGRVQSVTLRLICDREQLIRDFIEEEYWSITVDMKSGSKAKPFEAKFYGNTDGKLEIVNETQANDIVDSLGKNQYEVTQVKIGSRTKNTLLPFTTSTLQQEASKHLGFTTLKTMKIAQQLYEGIKIDKKEVGLITYLRTDSTRISDQAQQDLKAYIGDNFGEEYFDKSKIVKKSKKSNVQDAHEAIRPTGVEIKPNDIKSFLSRDQNRLYKLIWERFIASGMAPAKYETYSIKIKNGEYVFNANSSIVLFDGFLAVYNMDKENTKQAHTVQVEEGQVLDSTNLKANQHFTQPPARYTEASLVKTLEENGVGRPSTYAPTISTLFTRGYVVREKRILYPTELGEIINDIMVGYFKDIVDVEFTANLEQVLDGVETGKSNWKQVIRDFYPPFSETLKVAEEEIGEINIVEETDILCEKCNANMVVKYGRFGKFIACPNFPECRNTKPFYEETGILCTKCGGKVFLKKTKKGRNYYGCENNPECEFMSWDKPTGEKCPLCQETLVEKGGKTKKIVCNNKQCNFGKEKK